MKQLHGKELSFNNILDLNAAVDTVKEFEEPAAVVIKHGNPTGIAQAKTIAQAYQDAFDCDRVSAFGGVIGLNRKVDLKTARLIVKSGFMECVIAPWYEDDVLKILGQRKNIRLMQLNLEDLDREEFDFKRVHGGILMQNQDQKKLSAAELKTATKLHPSKTQIDSLLFAWKAVKNAKSNAIVLSKGTKTVGIGCGHTSRVGAAKIAIEKAGKNVKDSVLASDAFIPMPDTVQLAAKAGIKAIIQTGGSISDQEVIKAADKAKIAMVFSGVRHFKH
jgi:phosphoribosylaminoimidazolecarboxamide formyltransferase/IMP cyclohydrolase